MQLEYVDIFYHHRPDPETPLEETMAALDLIVRQGKALYVGLSNYNTPEFLKATAILKELGTPCLIHQPKYSMFERWVEKSLLDTLEKVQIGCIPFSPLAQGLLTNKYLKGIPENSRLAKAHGFLTEAYATPDKIEKAKQLSEIALQRNQSLAQMAIAWLLKDKRVTSVLVGASSSEQLLDSLNSIRNTTFSEEELISINNILNR